MNRQTAHEMLKEAFLTAGLNGKLATHSLRKSLPSVSMSRAATSIGAGAPRTPERRADAEVHRRELRHSASSRRGHGVSIPT